MLTRDMDFADYLAAPYLSSSDIKLLLKSPRHFIEKKPKDPTPEMKLGSLVHSFLLEPHTVAEKYIVKPDGIDRRTKEGKLKWLDFLEQTIGKTIVDQDEWDLAAQISENLMRERGPLFQGDTVKEGTIFFDGQYGNILKARPDLINLTSGIIFDIKVTGNCDFSSFQRSVAGFGYHIQAQHYLTACRQEFKKDFDFVWIVIERDPPFGHRLYTADRVTLNIAEREIDLAISTHKKCLEKNDWPCYDANVTTVGLPAYYLSPALN